MIRDQKNGLSCVAFRFVPTALPHQGTREINQRRDREGVALQDKAKNACGLLMRVYGRVLVGEGELQAGVVRKFEQGGAELIDRLAMSVMRGELLCVRKNGVDGPAHVGRPSNRRIDSGVARRRPSNGGRKSLIG